MRNVSVDIAKVFFAIMIVATHLYILHEPFYCNYAFLAVEFFFFCTGFFLASHIKKRDEPESTASFLGKKIKIFIFMLIAAEILSVLTKWIATSSVNGSYDLVTLINNAVLSINELLFLQMANIPCYYGLGTGWYFSAMILGLAILYPICVRHKKFMGSTSAVIGIILLGFIYVKCGNLLQPGSLIGGLSCGLIRGIADMCIGLFMYTVVEKMSKTNFTKKGKSALTIAAIALIIWLTWFMLSDNNESPTASSLQFIAILSIFVITTILLSESSFLNLTCNSDFGKKIADNLGKISLLIILNHFWVMEAVYTLIPNESALTRFAASVLGIIISIIACHVLSKLLERIWKKILALSISTAKTD